MVVFKSDHKQGKARITILIDLIAFVFLVGTGVIIIWPIFSGGITPYSGSIEGAFIADAKFITEHFSARWNSLWYTGFPSHLFYTPLVPDLIAIIHKIFSSISLSGAYRFIIGFFYCLTPFTLYLFTRYLTKSRLLGFLAGIFYLLLPSPLAIVNAGLSSQVAENFRAPWQLLTMLFYGEGPHIVALAFVPLACLFFLKGLRNNIFSNLFWAAFFVVLVGLINWISLIGLIVFLLFIFVIEGIVSDSTIKFISLMKIILMTIVLSAFWFNLSFIKASLSISSGGTESFLVSYLRTLPLWFIVLPILIYLIVLVVKGHKKYFPYIFAILTFLSFSLVIWFYFHTEKVFLPQPNRYIIEAQFAFCWLLVLLIGLLLQKVGQGMKILLTLVIILTTAYLTKPFITNAHSLVKPIRNLADVPEYQISQKLAQLNPQKERSYLSGSYSFWLNAFEDIPQIRGGNDGVANPKILDAFYQINTSENAPRGAEGQVAYDWLRILNVAYLVVNTPSSPEIYHDFKKPEKFDNLAGIEKLEEINGDIIYQITLNQPQLAQAVKKEKYQNLIPLINAVDQENLKKYVDYIDDPEIFSQVNFQWQSQDRAIINYGLDTDQALSVQINYHPGWQAYKNNQKISIKKDIFGFMYLDPGSGQGEIDLRYHNTWDVWFGYVISLLGIIGLIIWYVYSIKKRGAQIGSTSTIQK